MSTQSSNMSTTHKIAWSGLLVGVVLALALFYVFFPRLSFGASPAGSTMNDARQAATAVALANVGANGTSTSMLNTDGNDRYIISEHVVCETVGTSKVAGSGGGLASLTETAATSSTASPAVNANTNTLPVITIATSTPNFGISSSTVGTPGNSLVSNVWGANSYLTFFSDATNTANCTIGVTYLGL